MKKDQKSIFFTSDWHIGHGAVLDFDKRPFTDLDHMHRVLINNYNSTVPENGLSYFLGDCGLCKADILQNFMSKLNNSTKVLILGNHDSGMNSMYAKGFDVVLNSAIIYIGKNRVSMSHCPLPGVFREDITGMKGGREGENWHGEFKNQRFTNHDLTVDYHIHGHIHSGAHNNTPKSTHNQFDVGVAANGYRPVSISEIESWITLEEKKKLASI
jgi:calcineurin-like phosphoesterase family protein